MSEIVPGICSVQIRVGKLLLTSLNVTQTYGGLIEGGPSKRFNDRLVQRALESASRGEMPVHLVPPVIKLDERRPHDPTEVLPPLRCIGFFHGPPTPRAVGDWWRTDLVVVWFQEPSERILHPDVEAQMWDLPWEEKARDLSFDDW
ncbi:hypothetical protein [Actinomadura logoneensis]|uniref:hypothetical protein n=1 Tax=Actinomadura logoneensis TaxID=2293572 RepID=UPI0011C0E811|nr:hypothetical protein [Actinomadura logoneensis]